MRCSTAWATCCRRSARKTRRARCFIAWIHTERHGDRAAFTSILYLLEHPAVSHLHRLDAEELWNWHGGEAMDIHVLCAGQRRTHRLGPGPQQAFQLVVPVETLARKRGVPVAVGAIERGAG